MCLYIHFDPIGITGTPNVVFDIEITYKGYSHLNTINRIISILVTMLCIQQAAPNKFPLVGLIKLFVSQVF